MWRRKNKGLYLDFAASAPVSTSARRAFLEGLRLVGNPGALHEEAHRAKELLEQARTTIARLGQVKAGGVVFTSGATEANALAILGSVRARILAGTAPTDIHVLYHPGAHSSLVGSVELLNREGVATEALKLHDGVPALGEVQKQLRPTTFLVSLEAVSGETGTIFDTRALRRVLDAYEKEQGTHILLHVDASQAPRVLSFSLPHLGASLLSLDAQKVGGVRGIGALLIAGNVSLAPLMRGGAQEGGRRPGTENPALASAFAVALSEVQATREKFVREQAHMREALLHELSDIPHMYRNESKHQASHILNLSMMGRDTDYLVMLLNARGYYVSTKSACETDEPGSRMVLALTEDEARATSTLRISWGPDTTKRDLIGFARALVQAVRFLDEKAIY